MASDDENSIVFYEFILQLRTPYLHLRLATKAWNSSDSFYFLVFNLCYFGEHHSFKQFFFNTRTHSQDFRQESNSAIWLWSKDQIFPSLLLLFQLNLRKCLGHSLFINLCSNNCVVAIIKYFDFWHRVHPIQNNVSSSAVAQVFQVHWPCLVRPYHSQTFMWDHLTREWPPNLYKPIIIQTTKFSTSKPWYPFESDCHHFLCWCLYNFALFLTSSKPPLDAWSYLFACCMYYPTHNYNMITFSDYTELHIS